MAHQSSNILVKDISTCLLNHQKSDSSSYPSLVQRNVVLKFDESELKLCGFIDRAPLEALKFFWDLVLKKGPTAIFLADQLYCQIQKADPRIQQIIRNPKDVKDFLSNYPPLFTIDGEKISLSNPATLIESHMKWIKTLLQNEYPDINKSITSAIQFYSDILFDKEDKFPIDKLVTHRNKAKQEVQIIAINPLELKSFLIAYPQVFIVHEDKVSLTYSAACCKSDSSWLEEMCGVKVKTPRLRLLGKAVLYYLLILFKQETVHRLSLSELFTFRNVASKDVKDLTKTEDELKKFFVKYLCVFQINKNDVVIKDSLLGNLKRDEQKFRAKKGIDLSMAEVISIIHENLIKVALDICLRTIGKMLELNCLLEVPVKQLLSEFEFLFENENDLKTFISYHPDNFIVKDDTVFLIKSDHTNDMGTPMKFKLSSLNESLNPTNSTVIVEQVKDFCVNFLLQNVGVNVQFPLAQFKNCICLAPLELQQILSDEKEFRSIISRYPNILNVTDNFILLKRGFEDHCISSYKSKVNESLMFFVWVLKEKVGANTEFPIARLKIYVDLAPSEIKIKDIFQLKTFLKKYPNIFIVNNNNVILKKIDDDKYSKYTSYDKLCYVESYSTAEAIYFYARVLKRFCSNLEVPVEHLFGYRSLAPVEVIALAKDPSELKKFLSTHPDIFTVHKNSVCLSKSYDRSESNVEICDNQEGLAIKFYSSILDRVSHNNEFPIVRLFGYQYLASPEIRDLIKTPLELKAFLNKYPNVFFMNNDVVFLKESVSRNKDLQFNEKLRHCDNYLKEVETAFSDLSVYTKFPYEIKSPVNIQSKTLVAGIANAGINSRKSSIIRTIRFYSNIMFQKGPSAEHLVANLISFRSEATNDIKEVVKKPTELLTFLSKFPQIFTVNSDKLTVMLTDMISFYKNERNWIKELLPKYHQSTTNHEAVVSGIQFYVNIIFERGSELPIKSLFRYRKTAMGDVQTLANSANELKDFLSMYPEIFIISDEGVSLTAAAVSHKIEPKWIEEIVGDNDFLDGDNKSAPNENKLSKKDVGSNNPSTNQNISTSIDVNTMMTINFFKSILETVEKSKNSTYDKLFEYLHITAPQEVKESFKSLSELKDFFTKHPEVFTVKDNCVILVSAENDDMKDLKVKKKRKQRAAKNSSKTPILIDNDGNTENKPDKSSQISNINYSDNELTQVSEKKNTLYNLISTVSFFSNVIWRKGPHLEHSIASIFSHSSKASSAVRQTVRNPKELKELLSKYPLIFTVNHEKNTVTLADMLAFHKNQCSWIKELLPEHHQFSSNPEIIISTIQFYSNILFEKSPKCELALSNLFSYRNIAMEDVQMMVKNMKELSKVLSMFPDIFIVIKDKVCLTDLAISQMKHPKWIEELVSQESIRNIEPGFINSGGNTSSINQELLKQKKIATRRAVQFYYKIMLRNVSNTGFSLSHLFDYLHEASNDVKEVARNIAELRNFFSKYPHIFTISDNMVFLTSFSDK